MRSRPHQTERDVVRGIQFAERDAVLVPSQSRELRTVRRPNQIILTTGLPAPSNLGVAAVPASVSKLVLSWTDNSNNEDGFQIYRKSVGTGTGWAPVRYSPANSTTWQDSGLQPGTTYRYRILAKVPARSSGPAMDSDVAEASATTSCVPAIAVTGCVLVEPDANASAPGALQRLAIRCN